MLRPHLLRKLSRLLVILLSLATMAVLVLWMSGVFRNKLPPTERPAANAWTLPTGVATIAVATATVPMREEAVGAIRAVQEVQISSRILARIRAMHITSAGQTVKQGDLLIELEDDDLRAHLRETEAAQRSAADTKAQAERELTRKQELQKQQIASDRDVEYATTALANAAAELERATQNKTGAATMLSFAQLRAPIDGIVIDKRRQAGDTAAPGEVLASLYDPSRMQLVASVREELAQAMQVGGQVAVRIDALNLDCHGVVSEVVPQAAAGSRSFDVKVTGPCPPGVFSGMFGRLFVDLGTRQQLHVPVTAVRQLGQIDQAVVIDGQRAMHRRFVVLGEHSGDQVEVISGLAAGEIVVADASALRRDAGR